MRLAASVKEGSGLLVLLSVASIMALRDWQDPSLSYPDADRLLLDGVFLLDFLHDLPLDRIYDYTIEWYAQYPALSIGYKPPLFPFVEAIFNGLFGLHHWSSRLALLAFFLVGITAWFFLLKRMYGVITAFWSTALLISMPFVIQWSWYPMTELPVLSLVMLSAYYFYRYLEAGQSRFLYLTAITICFAVWTKQTAFVVAIWFIFYVFLIGRLTKLLSRKELWFSTVLVAILLAPIVLLTLLLGDQNLAQSIGIGGKAYHLAPFDVDNLMIHLRQLTEKQATIPLLALSLVGMSMSILNRDRKSLYLWSLIIMCYLVFTILQDKDVRHTIYWLPAICAFAAMPLYYIKSQRFRYAWGLVAAFATISQIVQVYAEEPKYSRGYGQAAAFVIENSTSPVVFFDGHNDGQFIYNMRVMDAARSMYVLRGDKLLSSSSISPAYQLKKDKNALAEGRWVQIHVTNSEEIENIFRRYGVQYIVVEKDDRIGLTIHKKLREFLVTGPFRLVRELPVESNRKPLIDQTLRIYEYMMPATPTADYLELHLPIVGKVLRVPVRGAHR